MNLPLTEFSLCTNCWNDTTTYSVDLVKVDNLIDSSG